MSDGVFEVLEVDSKETGATDLINKLDQIEKHLAQIAGASHKAEDAHKKHGEHVRGLAGAFHHLIDAGMEPFLHKAKEIAEFEFLRRISDKIIEAPAELIEKLAELGEEMVTTAAHAERTNTSFELLFGKEPGHEVLEYIEDIAKATEFSGEKMKGAAMELAKVGFAGEGLKRALAASIDIAALSPNKEEGMGSALSAIEQIKNGRIGPRQLLRFGLGPEQFFQEMSQRTGKGVATLKKEIASGKVDSEEALESLYTLIAKKTGEKNLGEAGLKVGTGLEAKMTHLKELPELFFEKLANTKAFDTLSAAADRLLEKLNPDSKTGKKLFETLEHAATAVVDAIDNIDIEHVGTALEELAEDVKPVINAFRTLGHVVGTVVRGIEAIAESRIGSLIGTVGKATAKHIFQDTQVGFAAKGLFDYVTAPPSKEPDHTKSAEEHGKAVGEASAEGQAKGMEVKEPVVERGGEKLGDSAEGGTRRKLKTHSPSKVFEEIGQQTAAGFAAGVEGSSGMIDDVLDGAFAVPAPQGGRMPAIGGAPIVVTMGDIIVSTQPGSNASETAQALRTAVRDELTDLLERFRAQQGG